MISGSKANAQSYLINEGFEGETFPPTGWTVIDKDGDGHSWTVAKRGDATLNGAQTAISYTVDPADPKLSYGEQENYLITPRIDVKNETFQLAFKYCAQDLETDEQMEVRISTTGTDPDDFTDELYKETVSNGYEDYVYMQSLTRSLKQYAGKKIYIAFVHKGKNTYALGIDDVTVTNQSGPKKITGLTVTPGEKGALTATLSWTNPATDGSGTALTTLDAGIYRDNKLIHTMTGGVVPGDTSTYTDNTVATGTHTYSVVVSTDEGQSSPVSKTVYVGEDMPAAARNVTANAAEGKVTLTWDAPSEGKSGGYINPEGLTYNIERTTPDGSTTLKTGLAGTSLTDNTAPATLTSYTVTPVNAAGQGDPTKSNAVITYSPDLKDIAAGAAATTEYGNPKLPMDVSSQRSISQVIYYPGDLMNAKGTIKSIVYKNNFRNTDLEKPVTIYMAETDLDDLKDGWMAVDGMTKVFNGTLSMTKGDNDVPLEFTTPFEYSGKNLVVCVQMDYVKGTGSYFDRFFVEQTPGKAERARFYSSYSDINLSDLQPSTGDLVSALPLTRFIVEAKSVAGLSGTVTDGNTGEKVAGAKVQIEGLNLSSVTGADGRYSFYIVPSGTQQVKITATGYADKAAEITVQDGGEQTADFKIDPKATIAVSGKVTAGDTGEPAQGTEVKVSGYSEATATTAADGSFELKGIYAGEAYTLRIEKSLYDVYTKEIKSTEAVDMGSIALSRSLIAAYGVTATTSADGDAAEIAWKDPLSRTGKTQWTKWGESENNSSTSGDYSSKDYNVGHAFTADDIKQLEMAGQSFTKLRVYIKATQGTFTAKVWKGTRDDNTVMAEKEIPTDSISPDGSWVTVDFDAPGVEIRDGESYIVGVNCKNASDSPIGCAGYGTSISGKNNLKWSDDSYLYDGYYAWNISALCAVPGTELPLAADDAAPRCTYSVYRTAAETGKRVKISSSPVQTTGYTDEAWDALPSGKYLYSVKAVYKNGESADATSDTVVRSVNTDASVRAFISPVKTKDPQTQVEVKVTIANLGEKPLTSFPVYFTVNGGQPTGITFEGNLAKGETADVTLGTADVSEKGTYTFRAYTAAEGDETPANDTLTFVLPNYDDVTLYGYRWDAYGYAGMMKLNSNIPEQAALIKEVTPDDALVNAGEYLDGHLYAFTSTWYSAPQKYVVMDTLTWTPGKSALTEDFVQDMAYDYSSKTMYALRAGNNTSELVTVNLTDGSLTLIGSTGLNMHAMACSKEGTLYAVTSTGDLCTIDKATAAPTTVGNTGVTDVKHLQSMAFDHNSGRLFWSQTGSQIIGHLYELDPQTAIATPLGYARHGELSAEIIALYSVYKGGTTDAGTAVTTKDKVTVKARYALDGRKLSAPEKGVNILKLSDGRTVKQVVR